MYVSGEIRTRTLIMSSFSDRFTSSQVEQIWKMGILSKSQHLCCILIIFDKVSFIQCYFSFFYFHSSYILLTPAPNSVELLDNNHTVTDNVLWMNDCNVNYKRYPLTIICKWGCFLLAIFQFAKEVSYQLNLEYTIFIYRCIKSEWENSITSRTTMQLNG